MKLFQTNQLIDINGQMFVELKRQTLLLRRGGLGDGGGGNNAHQLDFKPFVRAQALE